MVIRNCKRVVNGGHNYVNNENFSLSFSVESLECIYLKNFFIL